VARVPIGHSEDLRDNGFDVVPWQRPGRRSPPGKLLQATSVVRGVAAARRPTQFGYPARVSKVSVLIFFSAWIASEPAWAGWFWLATNRTSARLISE